jgi:hypothetical protein
MKCRALLLAVSVLASLTRGDEFRDLGVLTPRMAIPLERNTERGDFAFFQIEARSLAFTNSIKFNTTNQFLFASNFVQMPSGKILLAVKTIAIDGTGSPVSTHTFELWRSAPLKPVVGKVINLSGSPAQDSLDKAMERRKKALEASAVPPPIPGMASIIPAAQPMAGGKPEDYSQHLDQQAIEEMNKHFNKALRKNK